MAAPAYPRAPLLRFADTVGDGTGSIDAIGDYSVTPGVLKIVPPADHVFIVDRFTIVIADAGNMDSSGYGNNGANPLTNGVTFSVVRDGETLLNFTWQGNIKTNADWAMYLDSLTIHSFGSGDEYLVGHLDEAKLGWPRYWDGRAGDEFHFTCNDDLTHLTKHRCLFVGSMVPVEYFNPAPYYP